MTTRILDLTGVSDDSPYLTTDQAQGAFFTSVGANDFEVFSQEISSPDGIWRCDDTLPATFTTEILIPAINENSRGIVVVTSGGSGLMFLARDTDVRVFAVVANALDGSALATYSTTFAANAIFSVESNQTTGDHVVKNNGSTLGTYNSGLSSLYSGFTCRSGGSFKTYTLTYSGGGGATINSYPASVKSGQTGISYTTTGLTAVSGITIGSLAATSISDTSGDGTHSMPALTDGVAHELYGTRTVTITGTGGSPTTTSDFQPPTGLEAITLSGTLNTSEEGGLYLMSPAPVVPDQIVCPPDLYDAQGNLLPYPAGEYLCWHIQASTKIARSYTVILGVAGGTAFQGDAFQIDAFQIDSTGDQNFTAPLLSNTQTFFDATVTSGLVNFSAPLLANNQVFFAATVTPGVTNFVAPLLANLQTFFGAMVTPGSVNFAAPLLTNTQAFFDGQITAGVVNFSAPLLTNSQTFFGGIVSNGETIFGAPLLVNGQTFFGGVVSPGVANFSAPLLVNDQVFFGASVTPGIANFAAPLLTNNQTFFGATVTPGSVNFSAPLLTNTQTFFDGQITQGAFNFSAPLLTNDQTFFGAQVTPGVVNFEAPLLENVQSFFGGQITGGLQLQWFQNLSLTVYYRPTDRRVKAIVEDRTVRAAPLDRTVKFRF